MTPFQRKVINVTGCISTTFILGTFSVILVLALTNKSSYNFLKECRSADCLSEVRYLDALTDDAVDPCVDFYGHVCGRWNSLHGGGGFVQDAFRRFFDSLKRAVHRANPSDFDDMAQAGERLFTLTDFTIQDSKVGRYMRVNYTVEVHGGGGVVRSPAVKFTVHNSNNLRTPCVDDFGSCTYKACGGTKLTERMIGAGWNNSCKNIPNGVYQSSILLKVIPAVLLVFGNGTFNIQVEGISEKGRHECVSFDIFIEK
ncbi:uncharacterized protein LOC144141472 [Haemaphysalis longicornis]